MGYSRYATTLDDLMDVDVDDDAEFEDLTDAEFDDEALSMSSPRSGLNTRQSGLHESRKVSRALPLDWEEFDYGHDPDGDDWNRDRYCGRW